MKKSLKKLVRTDNLYDNSLLEDASETQSIDSNDSRLSKRFSDRFSFISGNKRAAAKQQDLSKEEEVRFRSLRPFSRAAYQDNLDLEIVP